MAILKPSGNRLAKPKTRAIEADKPAPNAPETTANVVMHPSIAPRTASDIFCDLAVLLRRCCIAPGRCSLYSCSRLLFFNRVYPQDYLQHNCDGSTGYSVSSPASGLLPVPLVLSSSSWKSGKARFQCKAASRMSSVVRTAEDTVKGVGSCR